MIILATRFHHILVNSTDLVPFFILPSCCLILRTVLPTLSINFLNFSMTQESTQQQKEKVKLAIFNKDKGHLFIINFIHFMYLKTKIQTWHIYFFQWQLVQMSIYWFGRIQCDSSTLRTSPLSKSKGNASFWLNRQHLHYT